jgi:hypothetical protein
MIQQSDEEVNMRRYLLGDVDETQREQLEERILCDKAFAERLSIAQDHLIDDYVFDGLSEADRQSFETNFVLNKERRNKLRIAQALDVYVTRELPARHATNHHSRVPSELWRTTGRFMERYKLWATVAFAIVVLLVFLGPKLGSWLMPRSISPLAAERARMERELADLNQNPSLAVNSATIDLALQPTILREGGDTKRVVLTRDIHFVRLKLEFPQVKYDRYRAVVKTVEDLELFAINGLKSERETDPGVILLRIPSEFLATNDYQIELQGIKADRVAATVAHYTFRIIKNDTTH